MIYNGSKTMTSRWAGVNLVETHAPREGQEVRPGRAHPALAPATVHRFIGALTKFIYGPI